MLTKKNVGTLLLGAALTVLPQVIPFIPHPYGDIATGVLGILTGLYHLKQNGGPQPQLQPLK